MKENNLGQKCEYTDDCTVFNSKEETNGTPVYIYRNVFCNRGYKGWKNCEQYIEYKLNTIPKDQRMMSENKMIDLNNVTQDEREILLLLERTGKCLYGNIFKELNISSTKGAELILSLASKGYIINEGKTSFYQLNGDLI